MHLCFSHALDRRRQLKSRARPVSRASACGWRRKITYNKLQVVTGLATLQSAVQDLSSAYLTHTNTVIGKARNSALEPLTLANPFGGDIFRARPAIAAPNADNGESKKRKRHFDKNAPKRPVTPYFLYMHTARPQIAAEMPPNHTAKGITNEGLRRWVEMKPEEREVSSLPPTQSHMPSTYELPYEDVEL